MEASHPRYRLPEGLRTRLDGIAVELCDAYEATIVERTLRHAGGDPNRVMWGAEPAHHHLWPERALVVDATPWTAPAQGRLVPGRMLAVPTRLAGMLDREHPAWESVAQAARLVASGLVRGPVSARQWRDPARLPPVR